MEELQLARTRNIINAWTGQEEYFDSSPSRSAQSVDPIESLNGFTEVEKLQRNLYAMLEIEGRRYLMNSTKIIIGRKSEEYDVDVSIGNSTMISRRHAQIEYSGDSFNLKCFSKNGLFANGKFIGKGGILCPLPTYSKLMFRNTSVELIFRSLIREPVHCQEPLNLVSKLTENCKNRIEKTEEHWQGDRYDFIYPNKEREGERSEARISPISEVENISGALRSPDGSDIPSVAFPLNINIPSLKSPCLPRYCCSSFPSPTGTISVPNSCPTSPGNGRAFDLGKEIDNAVQNSSNESDVKPPYSYAQLIMQAIASANNRQLTLNGIYSYITRNYPFYRTSDKGWQNSIRHNLSLSRNFIKVPRSQEEPGKGSFWKMEPQSESKLIEQAFRPRRQRGTECVRSVISSRSAPASPTHRRLSNSVQTLSRGPSPLSGPESFAFPTQSFTSDNSEAVQTEPLNLVDKRIEMQQPLKGIEVIPKKRKHWPWFDDQNSSLRSKSSQHVEETSCKITEEAKRLRLSTVPSVNSR